MDWMTGIERHQVTQGGPWVSGYPFRLVLHSTETDTFVDQLRYVVHFQADPAHQRLVQCISMNESAFGLEHVGGVETNRACAIQVEIVGRAPNQPWPNEWVLWLGKALGPVMDACGIKRRVPGAGQGRFTDDQWRGWDGICGHAHVPNQPSGHWDPGNFNYTGFAAASLPTPAPVPKPPEKKKMEHVWIGYVQGDTKRYILGAGTKHLIGNGDIYKEWSAQAELRGLDVLERPCTQAFLDDLTTV